LFNENSRTVDRGLTGICADVRALSKKESAMSMTNTPILRHASFEKARFGKQSRIRGWAWLAAMIVVAAGSALGFVRSAGCAAAGTGTVKEPAPIAAVASENTLSAPEKSFSASDNAELACIPRDPLARESAVFDELHWINSAPEGCGPAKDAYMSLERDAINPDSARSDSPRRNSTRVRRVAPPAAQAALELLESRQLMSVTMLGPTGPQEKTPAPAVQFALAPALDSTLNQVQGESVPSPNTSGTNSTPPSLPAQSLGLSATFNSSGIASLTYNNARLFDGVANPYDGFRVINYTLIQPNGTRLVTQNVDLKTYTTSWDAASQTVTWTFGWGSVSCKYTTQSDRLGMAITVNNTSTNTLAGLNVYTMALRFPSKATYGGNGSGVSFGTNEPGAVSINYSNTTAAIVNDGAPGPMYLGFMGSGPLTATANRYEVRVGTTQVQGNPTSWPTFDVPLGAHSSTTYNVSLRFAPGSVPQATIAADVYQRFGAANPQTLSWSDHRPIGELFPSSSGAAGRSATNPNGWFNDPNVNVTTPAGLAAFRTRLLAYADTSIQVLKWMNAQGAITWDIEGEQYDRADYIGDPRLATRLAPELTYVIDAYFKKFTDAGLRVGLTIRPSDVQFDANGPYQADSTNIKQTLIDKIVYAKNRWGCTLFYIDSTSAAMDGAVLKQVMDAVPGVLLIPENQNTKDYAYSAPYDEARQGVFSTPADVKAVYPNAFSVIEAGSIGTLTNDQTQQLQTAVNGGDIVLFPGWMNAPINTTIRTIYSRSTYTLPSTSTPATKLAAPLPTPQSSIPSSSSTPDATSITPSTPSNPTLDVSSLTNDLTSNPSTTFTFSDTPIGANTGKRPRATFVQSLLKAA
jgi:hypothetical protein